jgi:hypothetical protein
MSTAPSAIPTRGPIITPAIQVLLLDGELGLDVWSVGDGVLELDEVLVDMTAMLEEMETTDVAPMNVIRTLPGH